MRHGLSRRSFLRSAAAFSTGTALAPALAANDKIQMGWIGTGSRGHYLLERFYVGKSDRAAVVTALCDAYDGWLARAKDRVQTMGGNTPKTTKNYRELLADPSIDAVVIATPEHLHHQMAVDALKAGKHIYIEKPLAQTIEKGEEIVKLVQATGKVVQVGTQRRSWPGVIAAVEKLRQGAIGRVIFSRSWYNNMRGSIGRGKPAPVPDWLDWELWQGPAPRRPYRDNVVHYNWHWFWHWGTGEIGNNGVHGIDLSRWGLGVDFPVHVSSGGGRWRWDDDCETPDTQVVSFDFGDRMIVWECRNWHPRGPEGEGFGAIFYGEQGTLALSGGGYKIFDLKNKLVEEKSGPGGDAQHIANFLAAIRDGATANASIEVHYPSTLLCLLGAIAHRTRRSLKCDPKTGRILDDPEAAALWSRQYEPGWEPKV